MSFPMLSIKASGPPAQQNATGKKRSKAQAVIGYFFRKRESVKIHKHVENPQFDVVASQPAMAKLQFDIRDKNPYEVLATADISDIAHMEVEVDGTEMSLQDARRTGRDADRAMVRVPQRVRFHERSTLCKDACCQNHISVSTNVDDEPFEAKQIETMPRRLVAKMAATKKTRHVYSRLLNYLRCKHFMHIRDHHFITTLVADARSWLLKEHMDMEKPLTFAVLASAVTQAFMVNQEELDFRARMKNPIHLDHIEHLNNTMSGELGRVSLFKGDFKRALASAARRPFTRSVRIPTGPKTLI